MTNGDLAILVPVLIAALAAVATIRFTFRLSPTPRAALFSPVVFAVCGALIGISRGMIFLSDPEGRVMIDQGMLMVVGGGMLGAAIGVLARSQYLRMKRGQRIACLAMMTFLGACVAAPIGWLSGNVGAKTSYELKKRSADRMGWGIALGSGIGLFLGLPEVLIRRRGAV